MHKLVNGARIPLCDAEICQREIDELAHQEAKKVSLKPTLEDKVNALLCYIATKDAAKLNYIKALAHEVSNG